MDHEYLGADYMSTVENVKIIVEKVLRENMKEGGLNIKYFSWTQINFNKGTRFKIPTNYEIYI